VDTLGPGEEGLCYPQMCRFRETPLTPSLAGSIPHSQGPRDGSAQSSFGCQQIATCGSPFGPRVCTLASVILARKEEGCLGGMRHLNGSAGLCSEPCYLSREAGLLPMGANDGVCVCVSGHMSREFQGPGHSEEGLAGGP
jgi:hypothetical protein